MNTAQPIIDSKDLDRFKEFYIKEKDNPRNMLLITVGLNTALRISDVLELRWSDVYDAQKASFRKHITVVEQKTGKNSRIYMNRNIVSALEKYRKHLGTKGPNRQEDFLFISRNGGHISRVQAYRIIRDAARSCNIPGVISPHSLRKTFGYCAWKQGVKPVLLMDIYNHSSFAVTQRYLGIEQDDRDKVFKEVRI